jgi:predicted O-methyltransferase YrrM
MSIEEEAKKAVKKAMKVPGQIRAGEAQFLYSLARRKTGRIVEIGCLHGRSTSMLVQAAGVYKAKVTSIDPFYPTPNSKPTSARTWRNNLEAVGLEAPELLEMESHTAAGVYKEEIGFLFIDGAHDYEHIKQDIADWNPKIMVNGVMAFHDMFTPHISGVAQAVTEWWLSIFDIMHITWQIHGMTDFTIAFRRVQ